MFTYQEGGEPIKSRIKKVCIVYGIVAGILLAYYIFVKLTGIGIPCIFHRITGLKCPGCGNSRALIALAHLDFKEALAYNLFIFPELLFVGYVVIYTSLRYIKTGEYKVVFKPAWLAWAFLALLIIWWVVRNAVDIPFQIK